MRKTFYTIFLSFVMVLLYLPILVLAVYSFTDSANIGEIRGFSVQNYVTLFKKPELRDMIAGTLILAVGSAFISTVLGTLGAVGVFYSGRFGNLVVGSLNKVPVVNAEVVTAFSLCILLIGACGVDKSSFVSLVIGHVVLEAPFVYVSCAARYLSFSLPAPALFSFLFPVRFIRITIPTTTAKIIVESAQSAVLISVWDPRVAFTT